MPFAAFLPCPHTARTRRAAERAPRRSDVSTAHAAARKNRRLPPATTRNGMGEPGFPARAIAPRMSAPHKKIQPAASRAARTGARTSRPASMSAGAEKAAFMKAYKNAFPHPADAARSGALPRRKTKASRSGTSRTLSKLTPRVPWRTKTSTDGKAEERRRCPERRKERVERGEHSAQGTKATASSTQPTASPPARTAPPSSPRSRRAGVRAAEKRRSPQTRRDRRAQRQTHCLPRKNGQAPPPSETPLRRSSRPEKTPRAQCPYLFMYILSA